MTKKLICDGKQLNKTFTVRIERRGYTHLECCEDRGYHEFVADGTEYDRMNEFGVSLRIGSGQPHNVRIITHFGDARRNRDVVASYSFPKGGEGLRRAMAKVDEITKGGPAGLRRLIEKIQGGTDLEREFVAKLEARGFQYINTRRGLSHEFMVDGPPYMEEGVSLAGMTNSPPKISQIGVSLIRMPNRSYEVRAEAHLWDNWRDWEGKWVVLERFPFPGGSSGLVKAMSKLDELTKDGVTGFRRYVTSRNSSNLDKTFTDKIESRGFVYLNLTCSGGYHEFVGQGEFGVVLVRMNDGTYEVRIKEDVDGDWYDWVDLEHHHFPEGRNGLRMAMRKIDELTADGPEALRGAVELLEKR